MNSEFFDALMAFEKEKGIERQYLVDKIKTAIIAAVKRGYGVQDNIIVDIDLEKQKFYVAIQKTMVEEVENPALEIQVDEGKKYNKKAMIGDIVEVSLKTSEFGILAAQAAKQIIRQGIREAERSQMYKELKDKSNEIISAIVLRTDNRNGSLILDMGKYQSVLPKGEQVENEVFNDGEHIKVYVMEVKETERGPRIIISRSNLGLVRRLFEMEVPEILDGVVEIKSVSREAGTRTKIAVYSNDENVDAIGACIGPKRNRISKIIEELRGEKVDIIKYSDDPAEFIKESLSPAKVVGVEIINAEERICKVKVPDGQLSLAIGGKGKNAKLAAKLTGWKIDIKPESGFYGEE